MEAISDTKIAIGAIVALEAMLIAAAYLGGNISDTAIMGLASAGIGAIAGLAGFDMGKQTA